MPTPRARIRTDCGDETKSVFAESAQTTTRVQGIGAAAGGKTIIARGHSLRPPARPLAAGDAIASAPRDEGKISTL